MLVLAGGFGTRLQGVVADVPKVMVPINGTPLLRLQLLNWISQGQKSFTFLLHYKAEQIIDFLRSESKGVFKGIDIDWIVEEKPLGTGGAISLAIHQLKLNGSVLIANADTWLSSGLQVISDCKDAALSVVKVTDISRYGKVNFDAEGFVFSFEEKVITSTPLISGSINAGLYKLPTVIFLDHAKGAYSLENKILPHLAHNGVLRAVELDTKFYDIGVPNDLYNFCEWHQKEVRGSF